MPWLALGRHGFSLRSVIAGKQVAVAQELTTLVFSACKLVLCGEQLRGVLLLMTIDEPSRRHSIELQYRLIQKLECCVEDDEPPFKL